MRTLLITVVVAGCGFTPGSFLAPGDQPDGGGSATIDAGIDVPNASPDRDNDGVMNEADLCPDDADPLQRDHDGDGHGDVCDGCPHLPSASDPDGDGDEVGDACDPRPSTGGDERVMWFGFYADEMATVAGWAKTGTWTIVNDRLRVAKTNNIDVIRPPLVVQRAHLMTRMHLEDYNDVNAASGVIVGHVAGNSGPSQFYQCALLKSGPSINARSVSGDAQIDDQYENWGGAVTNGTALDITATIGSDFSCTYNSTTVTSNLGDLPGLVTLLQQRASVSYDYLFVVERGQ